MFEARRLAVLAEGKLGVLTSKTAACMVRYQPERIACVIDSTKAGLPVQKVLGFGGDIPIVRSIKEAVSMSPDTLLIGIAPRGGLLPPEWRPIIMTAIDAGLNVISGLHTMLGEDPEINGAARTAGVRIWDIRRPVIPDDVSAGTLKDRQGHVILTVGSDSRSGKMTVAFELARFLAGRGVSAEFVATGQTGILLAGRGVVIDRVPGDFMSRVVEDLTLDALSRAHVAIVEGQGSLVHPAFSGVALGILHGCYPDSMILCHQPSRGEIEGYGVLIPPVTYFIEMYERLSNAVYPSRVIGIALNTFDLDEKEAREEIDAVGKETGLPTADIIRWGCEPLGETVEAIL
jgi:uncharacterized NAD-dependent epimerase/dehydratase family protein